MSRSATCSGFTDYFAGGNTALGDDISVDGGAGTVTNMGTLQLATPETITGNFTQAGVPPARLRFETGNFCGVTPRAEGVAWGGTPAGPGGRASENRPATDREARH